MNKPLGEMFRYNKWATLTLLEACHSLTGEQLEAKPGGISGSIGELLTHIVGGQQSQVLQTKGRQHEGELSAERMAGVRSADPHRHAER